MQHTRNCILPFAVEMYLVISSHLLFLMEAKSYHRISQYFIYLNPCSFFQQHPSSFLPSFPFFEFVVRQSKVFSQTALRKVLSLPGCYCPRKCILYFVCWYGSEIKPKICCNEYKTMKVKNLKSSEGVLIPYLICIRNMNLVYSKIIFLWIITSRKSNNNLCSFSFFHLCSNGLKSYFFAV